MFTGVPDVWVQTKAAARSRMSKAACVCLAEQRGDFSGMAEVRFAGGGRGREFIVDGRNCADV